jgi:predicted TIM-barrel fold metal-dependent hydrolase
VRQAAASACSTVANSSTPTAGCYASSFQVDWLASGYDAIWRAFDEITAVFSEAERRKLFQDNAALFSSVG